MLLWGLVKCLWWSSKAYLGVKGGWQIKIDDQGRRVEGIWVRKRTWGQWIRGFVKTKTKRDGAAEEVVTERSPLLG